MRKPISIAPDELRKSLPKIEVGTIFEFDVFPFTFISYLNSTGATFYSTKRSSGKYSLEIFRAPRHKSRINRIPKEINYNLVVENLTEDIQQKYSEKNPEIFEQLKNLREQFFKKGRKISIRCHQNSGQYVSLDTCLARCGLRCAELDANKIKGENDNVADFFRDLLKYQRLVNVIYGTVRQDDRFKKDEE